jgi:L-alanine-DL-glutamate epimerase-like enolase superfamily enzyme
VFTISRGARTAANVVVAEITDGARVGRGECVPYPRYGETVEGVIATIESHADAVRGGVDRAALQDLVPAGAARNALDCALWDLEAKQRDVPAWQLAGVPAPQPFETAFTISLASPEEMEAAARDEAHRPLLKLKLTGEDDVARVEHVRRGAPSSRLIVDANEAWTVDHLRDFLPAMADLGVELIEQPLPAGSDDALVGLDRPVPICADESCHTSANVDALSDRYDFVNIKLDKTGGLTEALRLMDAARSRRMGVMVGCMIGTSLGIAPAVLLGSGADFADLDAPLWMADDRPHGVRFEGSVLYPPESSLWG